MVLAITKAFLVGWFFMHLKFEGRWIYMMLVPVGLLAVDRRGRPDARHRLPRASASTNRPPSPTADLSA